MSRRRSNEKVEALRQVEVLATLPEDELAHLAELANVIDDQPPGSQLITEGDRSRAAFLILEGEVEVRRGGRELGRLGPGQFVGEMASIDEQPRSAGVVTVGRTKLLVFHPRALDEMLRTSNELTHRLLEQISQRLRHADGGPGAPEPTS